MYDVSQEYMSQYRYEKPLQWLCKLEVLETDRNSPVVVTIRDDDIVEGSLVYNFQGTSDDKFNLGGVYSNSVSFTLNHSGLVKLRSSTYDYLKKNTCIRIKQWLKLDNDTEQDEDDWTINKDSTENQKGMVLMGEFYINSFESDDITAEVVCYDAMLAFDRTITSKDLLDLYQGRYTQTEWLIRFCESCSVDNYSITFDDFKTANDIRVWLSDGINLAEDTTPASYRDLIGYFSVICCGVAYIDRFGSLCLKSMTRYNTGLLNREISKDEVFDFAKLSDNYKYAGLRTQVAGFDKELLVSIESKSTLVLNLDENVWFRGIAADNNEEEFDTEVAGYLESMHNHLMDHVVNVEGFNFTILGYPEFDIFDLLNINYSVVKKDSNGFTYLDDAVYENYAINKIVYTYKGYTELTSQGYSKELSDNTRKQSAGFLKQYYEGNSVLRFLANKDVTVTKRDTKLFEKFIKLGKEISCEASFTGVYNVEIPGTIEFYYRYDGDTFFLNPKYTVTTAGFHTFSFTVAFDKIEVEKVHSIQLFVRAYNIEGNEFKATSVSTDNMLIIMASGIETGEAEWTGTYLLNDDINPLKLKEYHEFVSLKDNVVENIEPKNDTGVSVVLSGIKLSRNVFIKNKLSDSVNVNLNVE